MQLVTKAVTDPLITADDKTMSVSGWLSAPVVDRDGEIIDGSAFDLGVHKANPVALWMHKRNGLPIGRWEDANGNYSLRQKSYPGGGQGLYGRIYFTQAHPEGEYLYRLYEEKTLRAFSAGFDPKQSRVEKMGGKSVRRFTQADLHEGSCVNFAANPEAVATFVHKHAKLSPWLAEDLSRHIPKVKTFAASKTFSKINSSVNRPPLASRIDESTGGKPMAEVNTEKDELKLKAYAAVDAILESPDAADASFAELCGLLKVKTVVEPAIVTKADDDQIGVLTKNWNDAVPTLNLVPDIQSRLEALEANYVPRAEYDADAKKLVSAIGAVSEGRKVQFGS